MVRVSRVLLVATLIGVGGWVAGGCSTDESAVEGKQGAAAATTPTASAFATRSHLLVENLQARITPRATAAEDDGSDDYDPVTINADADPTSGGAPLTVNFDAEVSGGPPNMSYRWDFGDSSPLGHGLHVQHVYGRPGEYTATLRVTGFNVDEAQEVSIDVDEEGFDVDANADPDIGQAPLAVQFSADVDEDLGPVSFRWDFGDGAQDVSNPTNHTYRLPGEYTATLTVTNGKGQHAIREIQIQVDPHEEADDQ